MSAEKKSPEEMAEDLTGCIGLLVALPFTAVLGALVGGYTTSTLWNWFVVPFFGAAPLRLPVAAGLLLIVAYLRMDTKKPAKDTKALDTLRDLPRSITTHVLLAGFLLLEGYVLHRWFA